VTLEMIKFQHTLFALPFALAGMVLGAGGMPAARTAIWVVVAMVGARSAAMAFNRIVDRRIDALNPRTADRALPRGLLSTPFVTLFTLLMIAGFVGATWKLNRLCFQLSPVALAVILGYSFTKRFTWLCHFFLGLGLAIAPVGAWIAVTGRFDPFPVILAASILPWVAGFDILYALLDVEFDRAHNVRSIPARFGPRAARVVAGALHFLAAGGFVALGVWAKLGEIYFGGCAVVTMLLIYEHGLARPQDPGKLNRAFFHVNAVVSAVLLAAALVDLYNRPFA
jgi:4-hydroxybenzoate polyprenyltransferase